MSQPLDPPRPRLIVVRGKPGSGKTTLACMLGEQDALGLPVLSRDAIKAGMVETFGVETDAVRAQVVPQAFDLFERTVELWLRDGVSLIADEAFSRMRAEAVLRAWTWLAEVVLLHCETADSVAAARLLARERSNPRKRADVLATSVQQMENRTYPWRVFDAFDLGVPALRVDTTNGYMPALADIVAFCRNARADSA